VAIISIVTVVTVVVVQNNAAYHQESERIRVELEQARLQAERLEAERLEAERLELERLELERLDGGEIFRQMWQPREADERLMDRNRSVW